MQDPTRDQILSKHSLKLLVLQGNIWSGCQVKLQRFALVKKNTLVTAVFWLLRLTYKSLWPQGLAGCSLTLPLHNLPLFVCLCFCVFACLWASINRYACGAVPEFLLGVWKALRDKVDRLVCLVLIGLHGCGLWIKLSSLWFFWQRVLERWRGRQSRQLCQLWLDSSEFACFVSFFLCFLFLKKKKNERKLGREDRKHAGTHHELPVWRQQPSSVSLHLPILFTQAKLDSEPVQLKDKKKQTEKERESDRDGEREQQGWKSN